MGIINARTRSAPLCWLTLGVLEEGTASRRVLVQKDLKAKLFLLCCNGGSVSDIGLIMRLQNKSWSLLV
jgi:hypothetical protein